MPAPTLGAPSPRAVLHELHPRRLRLRPFEALEHDVVHVRPERVALGLLGGRQADDVALGGDAAPRGVDLGTLDAAQLHALGAHRHQRRADPEHGELVLAAEREIAPRQDEALEQWRRRFDFADVREVALLLARLAFVLEARAPAAAAGFVRRAHDARTDAPFDLEAEHAQVFRQA